MLKIEQAAADELAMVEQIEARTRAGRPLASPEWIADDMTPNFHPVAMRVSASMLRMSAG